MYVYKHSLQTLLTTKRDLCAKYSFACYGECCWRFVAFLCVRRTTCLTVINPKNFPSHDLDSKSRMLWASTSNFFKFFFEEYLKLKRVLARTGCLLGQERKIDERADTFPAVYQLTNLPTMELGREL